MSTRTADERRAAHRAGRSAPYERRFEGAGQNLVLKEPINVLAYGAKGDGVHDDLAAINAAIAAAGAGGQVYLPRGNYFVSDRILWNVGCSLLGDYSPDWTATKISSTNGTHAVIEIAPTPPGQAYFLRNITTFGGLYGLFLNGDASTPINFGIEGCLFTGAQSHGIYVKDQGILGVHWRQVRSDYNNGDGLHVENTVIDVVSYMNASSFEACHFGNNGGRGVHIDMLLTTSPQATVGNTAVTLQSCTFEGNQAAAIYTRATHLNIVGGHFEYNDFADIDGAEILLDNYYNVQSTPCALNLYGPSMQSTNAAAWIKFLGDFVHFGNFNTYWNTGVPIDCNSKICSVSSYGGLGLPTLNNTTNAAIVLANGFGAFADIYLGYGASSAHITKGPAASRGAENAGSLHLATDQNAGASAYFRDNAGNWWRRNQLPYGLFTEFDDQGIFWFPNMYDAHATTPEGYALARPGAVCIVTDAGGTAHFYVKKTGTGNTGWSEIALP